MFNPRDFKTEDKGKIRQFIINNSLGIMFSVSGTGDYLASHIPFLVDEDCRRLTGHMAKENPQWESLDGKNVLVVFQGPNHYISPTWYGETRPVPTWNYATVHAEGKFHVLTAKEDSMKVLDDLTGKNEESVDGNWKADWDDAHYNAMLNAIVPFTIDVEWIEGKWKFSQNHSPESIGNVSRDLKKLGTERAMEVADIMKREKKEHDRIARDEK